MPSKVSKSTATGFLATASTSSDTSMHAVSSEVPASLTDGRPLPRLIVFDLDYTLWPLWVDTHVNGSLRAAGADGSAVVDRVGERYAFYADVPSVLRSLPRLGVRLAVASRTETPDTARDLLKLLVVPPAAAHGGGGGAKRPEKGKKAIDFFDAGLQIYPGSKITHLKAIHRHTGIAYEHSLFFDDESRNRDTESLGLTMYRVKNGVTWQEIERGVEAWRTRRRPQDPQDPQDPAHHDQPDAKTA